MSKLHNLKNWTCLLSIACLVSACGGGGSGGESSDAATGNTVTGNPTSGTPTTAAKVFSIFEGNDQNTILLASLSLNPGGPGGSSNQSLRAGDVLQGNASDDVLIGGLGVDLLLGSDGDDILIGGTEDFNANVNGDGFNADNRDRALGGNGDDVFIWAPGDGSDFFDGGNGTDVVVFGVLGEARDDDGNTVGAPFFSVNPPGTPGSQDFDGIFLNATDNTPVVSVSTSPGFCSVIDQVGSSRELALLNIDKVVRFSLRGIANSFDSSAQTDDDGLRVAVSLKNTEFLVCTKRDVIAGGGDDNIEVIDLRGDTVAVATLDDLPGYVRSLLQ